MAQQQLTVLIRQTNWVTIVDPRCHQWNCDALSNLSIEVLMVAAVFGVNQLMIATSCLPSLQPFVYIQVVS